MSHCATALQERSATQLGPALGASLGAALSLWSELSASLGAFSLYPVGERLEDEPGETLGKPLRDSDAKEVSDTPRTSTARIARRSTFIRGRAEYFTDKLSPRHSATSRESCWALH